MIVYEGGKFPFHILHTFDDNRMVIVTLFFSFLFFWVHVFFLLYFSIREF